MSYTPKGITKLPWKYGDGIESDTEIYSDSERMVIASMNGLWTKNEANARYLVHAANEYPKAIDALRRLTDLLGHFEWTPDEDALAVLSRSAELEEK